MMSLRTPSRRRPLVATLLLLMATTSSVADAAPLQRDKALPAPTPYGGFQLARGRVGVAMELGYPNLEFSLGYGVLPRLQLELGYKGVYGINNGIFAGLKVGLYRPAHGRTALAARLRGGYRFLRPQSDAALVARLIGGGSMGFGELAMLLTVRGRRHSFLMAGGAGFSQVRRCLRITEWSCEGGTDELYDNSKGWLASVFAELGLELRIAKQVSFVFALGIDIWLNGEEYFPAMPRLRIGTQVEF